MRYGIIFFILVNIFSCKSIRKDSEIEIIAEEINGKFHFVSDTIKLKKRISKILFQNNDISYYKIEIKKYLLENHNFVYAINLFAYERNMDINTIRLLKFKNNKLFFDSKKMQYSKYITCVGKMNCNSSILYNNKANKIEFYCGKKGICSMNSKCRKFETLRY